MATGQYALTKNVPDIYNVYLTRGACMSLTRSMATLSIFHIWLWGVTQSCKNYQLTIFHEARFFYLLEELTMWPYIFVEAMWYLDALLHGGVWVVHNGLFLIRRLTNMCLKALHSEDNIPKWSLPTWNKVVYLRFHEYFWKVENFRKRRSQKDGWSVADQVGDILDFGDSVSCYR